MTVETYKFTDDTMFEALETFCLIHSIKYEEFCKALPEVIYRQSIFDQQTVSSGHLFKIKWNHPLCEPLAEYLDDRYSFESRVEKLVASYDDFFNKQPRKDCYYVNGYYAFDETKRLRKVYTFEFIDFVFQNDYMTLIEFDDSNLTAIEIRIFNYYFCYFGRTDIPDELKKPFSQLSKDEMRLLQMIYI